MVRHSTRTRLLGYGCAGRNDGSCSHASRYLVRTHCVAQVTTCCYETSLAHSSRHSLTVYMPRDSMAQTEMLHCVQILRTWPRNARVVISRSRISLPSSLPMIRCKIMSSRLLCASGSLKLQRDHPHMQPKFRFSEPRHRMSSGSTFATQMATEGREAYRLSADSANERESWVRTLRLLVGGSSPLVRRSMLRYSMPTSGRS
eukprot:SAG11_NODE_1729_length_4365_cov_2.317628_2_plen_202_part_00